MKVYKIKKVKNLNEALDKAKNIFFISDKEFFVLNQKDPASKRLDENGM